MNKIIFPALFFSQVICDCNDFTVGIYVTMPYPMTFNTFLDRMGNHGLPGISYVTKTNHKMDIDEIELCYEYGFFEGFDDGELY